MGYSKYLITVRFPEWGGEGEDTKFPAFGVRYLIEVPPGFEDKEDGVYEYFIQKYQEKIKKEFKGEVLFMEHAEGYCIL